MSNIFGHFSLELAGLHCGACVKTVTNALIALAPENEVTVTLGPPQIAVISGFTLPAIAAIVEEIEDLGFDVVLYDDKVTGERKVTNASPPSPPTPTTPTTQSYELGLSGLTCGSCVKTVTKVLTALLDPSPSTISIKVTLTTATINGTGLFPSTATIIEEIEDVGFDVTYLEDKVTGDVKKLSPPPNPNPKPQPPPIRPPLRPSLAPPATG